MTQLKQQIAGRMRVARENAGLSQGQVARLLGVHRPTISQIEAGQRRVSADELPKLAKLYGVSVGWLTCEEDPQPDPARDRIQLAARELLNLREEDLDRVLVLIESVRDAKTRN